MGVRPCADPVWTEKKKASGAEKKWLRKTAEVQAMIGASQVNDYMTIEQLAEYVKLKKHYLYRLTSTNQIPVIRVGRHLRFRRADIDAWLERLREEPVERHKGMNYRQEWRRRARGGRR